MGYSGRVVNSDTNGETPNALAKQPKFGLGPCPLCSNGDSEGCSAIKASENSSGGEIVAQRASFGNPLDASAERNELLPEPIDMRELERIARIGSWCLGPTGRMRWSQEMHRIYGVAAETFVPTVEALLDLVHPQDRQKVRAWFEAVVAADNGADKGDELEFRAILPDGSVRWIRARGGSKNRADIQAGQVAGTAQDITERKRMEQNLSEALEYSRWLIDVCPVGVAIYRATGECISANEAAAEIAGCSVDQLRKQNFRELQLRIPTKPATHSNRKPATDSD